MSEFALFVLVMLVLPLAILATALALYAWTGRRASG
jgi:hypothetical protein